MNSRDDIVTAALRHLNVRPTASTTEIAQAAGISRATLHRHFASRDDLLREIGLRSLEHWAGVQESTSMVAVTASGDPARLRACAEEMLRKLVVSADDYAFALVDEYLYALPEIGARTEELFELEVAFWAAALDAGVLRSGLTPRWVAHASYGVLVACREALRHGDVARRDVPDLVLSTFLHGVSA